MRPGFPLAASAAGALRPLADGVFPGDGMAVPVAGLVTRGLPSAGSIWKRRGPGAPRGCARMAAE